MFERLHLASKGHDLDERDSAQLDSVEHLPQLDGLRGLAILLVLINHFHAGLDSELPWANIYISLTRWCWMGVDLFFVLSGFLITSILWRYKSKPRYFINFYSRRILRIFPLYYFFLVIMLVIVPSVIGNDKRTFSDLWYWFYLTNIAIYLYGIGTSYLGPLWSLAMEEQYYLIWPFLVRFGNRRFITAVGCAFILIRIAVSLNFDSPGVQIFMHAPRLNRFDAFIIGSLIAIWRTELSFLMRGAYTPKVLLAALFAIPVCLGIYDVDALQPVLWPAWGKEIFYTLIASYFGLLLFLLLEAQPGARLYRFFSMGILRDLGKYSYAIYLFHSPLNALVRSLSLHPSQLPEVYQLPAMLPYFIIMTAEVYFLAQFSWWLFEARALRLKRYFNY